MSPGLLLAAALGLASLAGGAVAAPRASAFDEARDAYHRLQEDGPEARDPRSWRALAERFRRFASDSPALERADDALYLAGICLERANAVSGDAVDQERAVAAYDALAREHPGSNLADDGLLRAGRIRELGGDAGGARAYYRRILEAHPGGDMVAAARRREARVGRGGEVRGVRFFTGPDYTRVVIDLSAPLAFVARRLPVDPAAERPHRVYLDLTVARVGAGCDACYQVADGLVRRVRSAQHEPGTVRVVLDLDSPAEFRAFPLDGPARIVVDVFRGQPGGDVVAGLIQGAAPPAPPAPQRRPRLVIDPGHGGKDPGAIGVGGLKEKDVTLAIARELAELLRRRGTWEVRLTRERDEALALEERTAIANAFGADLFLSIHANASPDRRARGIETYYLERSSDRAARRLAALENAGAEEDAAEMEHILADVVLHSKVRDSRRLAEALQGELVSHLSRTHGPTRDLGVKRGPFYVLTGAFMPAVLVEAAFLTHPEESRRLADAGYRRETAAALARGIGLFAGGS